MRIDLYLDCVSPYSVFAAAFLERYQSIWGYELGIRPVPLGKVMQTQGTRGPARTKAKLPWLKDDIRRNRTLFQVGASAVTTGR